MPKQQKKSARKALYALHTWVGFHLAVIMFVVLLTGTFAVVANELDWLINPAMRVSVADSKTGEMVTWQEMHDALQAAHPQANIVGIGLKPERYFAARATIIDEYGIVKLAFVNQWTGQYMGVTSRFTFQYFFRNLHRYLFLPKAIGLTIVSSMAVILAISLYTGLKTSRNWRTLMTRIRVAKGVRIAIGDAHKFAGLWSIWFFVLMISTGLWYYAEFLGKDFEPRRPTLSEDMTQQMGDLVAFPAVTDIVRAAQRAYPELKISAVSYPDITRSPIMVDGKVGNPIVRLRANRVFLNPATLEVIKIHRDKDFGLVQWLNQIADPLHFGNFGGLAVKLIWFTFGLFLTGLSASGVWLTWQRLKSRGATKVQIALFPILLVSAFSGIGNYLFLSVPMGTIEPSVGAIWYIVAVMLGLFAPVVAVKLLLHMRSRSATRLKTAATGGCLLIMTGGFTHAVFIQQPLAPAQERAFDDVTDGPVSATLFAETAENSMLSGDIRITARSGDARHILHLKSVSMRLENQDGVIGKAVTKTINGALVTQNIRFKDTPIMDAERLRVTFELQSGKTYTAIWRVDRQLF